MSNDDIFISKLTAYREAADQGQEGLIAVLCVLRNRVIKDNSTYYVEATKPWQFSSMSIGSFGNESLTNIVPTQVEVLRLKQKVNNSNMFIEILSKYPNDPVWKSLDQLVSGVLSGVTKDITNGATSYYADGTTIPDWAKDGSMRQVAKIGRHIFFRSTK